MINKQGFIDQLYVACRGDTIDISKLVLMEGPDVPCNKCWFYSVDYNTDGSERYSISYIDFSQETMLGYMVSVIVSDTQYCIPNPPTEPGCVIFQDIATGTVLDVPDWFVDDAMIELDNVLFEKHEIISVNDTLSGVVGFGMNCVAVEAIGKDNYVKTMAVLGGLTGGALGFMLCGVADVVTEEPTIDPVICGVAGIAIGGTLSAGGSYISASVAEHVNDYVRRWF